jgi:hypothetical protein
MVIGTPIREPTTMNNTTSRTGTIRKKEKREGSGRTVARIHGWVICATWIFATFPPSRP